MPRACWILERAHLSSCLPEEPEEEGLLLQKLTDSCQCPSPVAFFSIFFLTLDFKTLTNLKTNKFRSSAKAVSENAHPKYRCSDHFSRTLLCQARPTSADQPHHTAKRRCPGHHAGVCRSRSPGPVLRSKQARPYDLLSQVKEETNLKRTSGKC